MKKNALVLDATLTWRLKRPCWAPENITEHECSYHEIGRKQKDVEVKMRLHQRQEWLINGNDLGGTVDQRGVIMQAAD